MADDVLSQAVLDSIPPPAVVQDVVFQTIYQQKLQSFVALAPKYTLLLESDPVVKLIQVFSYWEYLLRHRINEAARASLIAFAQGTDLDHVAAFYEVIRQVSEEGVVETDAAMRLRTIEAIKGRSTAGSAYWYRQQSLGADVRVKDAKAYSLPDSPIVYISILSTDNGGEADGPLLDAVEEVVQSDEVRVVNDTVVVQAATLQEVDIEANIWLLPDSPSESFDILEDKLADAFEAIRALGRDLTLSWITSILHTKEVQRVQIVTPNANVVVTDTAAVKVNSITLTNMGRDY